MVNIPTLVSHIIKKIEEANSYVEISGERLQQNIRTCLEDEYEKRISKASITIETRRQNGETITQEMFDKEYEKVDKGWIAVAKQLGATDLVDLQDLV